MGLTFLFPPSWSVGCCWGQDFYNGHFCRYRWGLRNQREHTALVKIEGVRARDETILRGQEMCLYVQGEEQHSDAWWQTAQNQSHLGTEARAHGNSGRFVPNSQATFLLRNPCNAVPLINLNLLISK